MGGMNEGEGGKKWNEKGREKEIEGEREGE